VLNVKEALEFDLCCCRVPESMVARLPVMPLRINRRRWGCEIAVTVRFEKIDRGDSFWLLICPIQFCRHDCRLCGKHKFCERSEIMLNAEYAKFESSWAEHDILSCTSRVWREDRCFLFSKTRKRWGLQKGSVWRLHSEHRDTGQKGKVKE
jgi:hypothetical protein